MMSRREVALATYDLLEAALKAGVVDDAILAVRPDLEVLPREDLLDLVTCVIVETTVLLTPPKDRPRLRAAVDAQRLHVMVAP